MKAEIIRELLLRMKEEKTCSVCNGPCEMDTEYEGSAICKDESCSVHKG